MDTTIDSTVQLDSIERCNDLMDMLNHLVAAQSREQWLSISHQQWPKFDHGLSSNTKGLHLCHHSRLQLVDIL